MGQGQNPTQWYLWIGFGDDYCERKSLFLAIYITPFVLGHEIVGEVAEIGAAVEGFFVGTRVVIEPALSCPVRGISPPCHQCRNQRFANCENITKGDISEGVQTGYCRDTGGGWSQYVLAPSVATPSRPRRYFGRNRGAT